MVSRCLMSASRARLEQLRAISSLSSCRHGSTYIRGSRFGVTAARSLIIPLTFKPCTVSVVSGSGRTAKCIHIPTVLMPPVVFVGLLVALYVWKCMMLVVFQNKIIYMPGFPPNSRWELIDNYADHCGGIKWTNERIQAADGTDLAMAITTVPMQKGKFPTDKKDARAHVYVLYFQGLYPHIDVSFRDSQLIWVPRKRRFDTATIAGSVMGASKRQ